MISIIFSWAIIIVYSLVIGYAFMHILSLDKNDNLKAIEFYILFGFLLITVYAQLYSLFSGLDGYAFITLTILFVLSGIYDYLHIQLLIPQMGSSLTKYKIEKIRWILLILAFLGLILWDTLPPQHYDTYLYHAQAIHWAEDYGIVPGLGNLHFRLAYNSAFMPLQAIFSFKWLFGQSLHTFNGLVTFLMLAYSFLTIKRYEVLKTSDYMKIGVMLYIAYDCFHVSSPNTDTYALIIVFFICMKWVEFSEQKIEDYRPYAFLSILAVYATSLKLSAGIVVLICLYPAIIMVREKKWLQIIKHLFIGTCILLPLMIRGYLISGYPLYPYDILSFGNPDWKMNIMTLISDREEIVSWARKNYDATRNSEPIWKWIGEWYSGINPLWKIVSILALLSIVYLIIYNIKGKKYKINHSFSWITLCSVVFVCFWMLSAPLPRYGIMYMIILICIAVSILCKHVNYLYKSILPLYALAISLYVLSYGVYISISNVQAPSIFIQGDYENKETSATVLGDVNIAFPIDSDQTGYDPFPSTISEGAVDYIELRGGTLADGFRIRGEGTD